MAGHTSEKRWRSNQTSDSGPGVSILVSAQSVALIHEITKAEELFQDLLELYTFVGATPQLLADQLFREDWITRVSDPVGAPGVFDTQANATELAKAQDLIDASIAMNDIYNAATNVIVTQSDRMAAFRRMS